MAQILAIDYGKARCGIAVTDDLQLIASSLKTVAAAELMSFLKDYFAEHEVATVVVGQPVDLRGNMSEIERDILKFLSIFRTEFPDKEIARYDERFTSKIASYTISQSGKNRKSRQEKGLIDRISATIILQNYLEHKQR